MPDTTAPATRLLAVEDDPVFARHLVDHLESIGYSVSHCQDGEAGLSRVQAEHFDLILMDIMLPGTSGLDVLEQLRRNCSVPVVLMSALGNEQDRITGFSQGADDYLPKPFSLRELSVRIEAVLRRVAYERTDTTAALDCGELHFDEQRRDVALGECWAGLTPSEYRVLAMLWQHAGTALSKACLYQQALHRNYSSHDRSLDMHVSHVRRKLKVLGCATLHVETVWGTGYMVTRGEQ
ncbi:response regulator transcription factor [Pseudomonas stutzeri]|uniref:DNA-binding response regulator n=1 Tax=Stutzerimonas stutzeri TaxID=316 RepID=A0A2N8S2P9_STUST|nr:response regulator transcription factor [Stutzerimonas stutzeri]MCQ4296463.1 response regulator transcription factor [Stutzerimonas stutzeri]PNF80898.1 DNA-binding response regulator [Stutzerimonas stutzeri]